MTRNPDIDFLIELGKPEPPLTSFIGVETFFRITQPLSSLDFDCSQKDKEMESVRKPDQK